MGRYLPWLLMFAILSCCVSQKYKKIVHLTDADAKCLDGTPPAIYVHQGT
jgi:hypothetical protein